MASCVCDAESSPLPVREQERLQEDSQGVSKFGIEPVDSVAALLDSHADALFDSLSGEAFAEFAPPRVLLCARAWQQRDTVPWFSRQAALQICSSPSRTQRDVAAEPTSPAQHVAAAWDLELHRPSKHHPLTVPHDVPDGAINALPWMRECPNFEGWLVGQVRRWRAIADGLEPQQKCWRAALSAPRCLRSPAAVQWPTPSRNATSRWRLRSSV